jgi:hypothetical protein
VREGVYLPAAGEQVVVLVCGSNGEPFGVV